MDFKSKGMIRSLYALLACLLLCTCSKPDKLRFTVLGRITNAGNMQGEAGVEVKIEARILQNGVYNLSPSLLDKNVTKADGSYELSFDKIQTEEFIISLSREGALSQSFKIPTDELYKQSKYTFNGNLNRLAELSISLKNANLAADSSAVFSYGYQGPELPCNCCPKNAITLIGAVDSSWTCQAFADRYFVYGYTVKRQGQPIKIVKDSLFLQFGQSNELNIQY